MTPLYQLKKETRLFVYREGVQYELDIYPDLGFSQTFNETSVPVKTLHNPYDLFDKAVINRANPANFNFTIPILYEEDLDIVLDLLLDYDSRNGEVSLKTTDIYVDTRGYQYKLENCVIESGTFQIQRGAALTLNVSGTASKLINNPPPVIAYDDLYRVANRTFLTPSIVAVAIAGQEQPSITGITLEVKNNVTWLDFATVQNSRLVTDTSGTLYPEAFVVSSRVLSGTVQQYITSDTSEHVQGWSTAAPISIEVGDAQHGRLLRVAIPAAVYTNRLEVQDLFIQSYDFRMVSNPTSLKDVFVKGVS